MEIFIFLIIIIALLSIAHSVIVLRKIKRQLADMVDMLTDVKNGNGNRRTLAKPHELIEPLAFELNDIISIYENKLTILRKKEETTKQLMTSLSHDVRTPLTTLIGYLDAAYKGIVTGKEREDYIKTARRKAHELKEYIDELFDWLKLNSNEFTMNIENVEVAELTRNVLIDWIPIFEEKKIDYDIDIPELPFWTNIDPEGYIRILNNLIQNVITHSHADKMEISLTAEGNHVKLVLSDNGIGINPEDIKHIFERLFKCDKSRSKKGSGLGLSIVYQLTKKMGGKISVESTTEIGTAFTLLFPLSEQLNSHKNVQ